MRKEDTTKQNKGRMQVGMLLAGLVLPGLEAGAAPDNQCPCDISVGVLARQGITPNEIDFINCHSTPPRYPIALDILTQTQQARLDLDTTPPTTSCHVKIYTLNGGVLTYSDDKTVTTDQQSSACEEDIRRTARALGTECPD